MPGLVISVGGRLDKSYTNALQQAAILAKQEQRKMAMIRELAPNQLSIVNRALTTLPQESLMRPKLEAMKATLTAAMGGAGSMAGQNFGVRFAMRMAQMLGGHEAKLGVMQGIHTLRATFDALVAGISPWRIFLYEAPQMLQSLTLMGGKMAGRILGVLFSPLLWISAAATAFGAVFVLWGNHLKKAAQAVLKFNQSFSDRKGFFESQASEIKRVSDNLHEASKAADEYSKFLTELDAKHESLATQIEAVIAAMREKFQLDQQIAEARGQSPTQRLAAEQAQRQAELEVLNKAKKQAQDDLDEARRKGAAAEAAYEKALKSKTDYEANESGLVATGKKFDQIIKNFKEEHAVDDSMWYAPGEQWQNLKNVATGNEKVMNAMKLMQWIQQASGPGGNPAAQSEIPRARAMLDQYKDESFSTDDGSGGKMQTTVASLIAIFDDLSAKTKFKASMEQDGADSLAKLKDAVDLSKTSLTEHKNSLDSITTQANKLQADVGIHKDKDAALALAGHRGAGGTASVTERERIGAYSASSIQVSILDINRKQLQAQTATNTNFQTVITQLKAAGFFK